MNQETTKELEELFRSSVEEDNQKFLEKLDSFISHPANYFNSSEMEIVNQICDEYQEDDITEESITKIKDLILNLTEITQANMEAAKQLAREKREREMEEKKQQLEKEAKEFLLSSIANQYKEEAI